MESALKFDSGSRKDSESILFILRNKYHQAKTFSKSVSSGQAQQINIFRSINIRAFHGGRQICVGMNAVELKHGLVSSRRFGRSRRGTSVVLEQ
jgi:hypothetical protein